MPEGPFLAQPRSFWMWRPPRATVPAGVGSPAPFPPVVLNRSAAAGCGAYPFPIPGPWALPWVAASGGTVPGGATPSSADGANRIGRDGIATLRGLVPGRVRLGLTAWTRGGGEGGAARWWSWVAAALSGWSG
jgi:hypothetical protein